MLPALQLRRRSRVMIGAAAVRRRAGEAAEHGADYRHFGAAYGAEVGLRDLLRRLAQPRPQSVPRSWLHCPICDRSLVGPFPPGRSCPAVSEVRCRWRRPGRSSSASARCTVARRTTTRRSRRRFARSSRGGGGGPVGLSGRSGAERHYGTPTPDQPKCEARS